MKNIIFILCSLISSFAIGQSCVNVPIRPITEGLVAYYPFTGNAQDASGTAHGTVNGAILTSDRFGIANRAYDFDRTNHYITANGEKLIFDTLTLSVWVYPRAIQKEWTSIMDKSHANNEAYANWTLQQEFNARIFRFVYCNNGTLASFENPQQHFNSIVNEWQHMLISKIGREVKLFLNGQLIGTKLYDNDGNIFNNTSPLYIGNAASWDKYFNGKIDDIRIYNRAMTECEVKDLYELERSPLKETSIQEVLTERIHLFPNPAQTILTIELENQNVLLNRLQILNALNIPVLEKTNSSNPTIDISNLPIGMYFLHIETQDGKQGIQKFVKN